MTRRAVPQASFALIFLAAVLISANVRAQTEPVRFDLPLTVLWILEEQIGEQRLADPLTPRVWQGTLEPLNVRYADPARAKEVLQVCPLDKLLAGDACPAITAGEADVVVAGRITAELRDTGPAGPGKGAKLEATLAVVRLDSGEKLFDVKQPSYGTGAGGIEAFGDALEKIAKPIAVRFSHLVQANLGRSAEGELVVNGFSSREEQEDLLIGLRFSERITSVGILDSKKESCSYRVGYRLASWGQIVKLLEAASGTGVEIKTIGDNKAEGVYSPARAFRLLVGVTAVNDKSGGVLGLVAVEDLPEKLERAVAEIDGLSIARLPFRLPADANKAAAEMQKQYGGDIALAPSITTQGDEATLSLVLQSTFAGRLLVVSETVTPGDVDGALQRLIEQIRLQLGLALEKSTRRMTPLKRVQYDAWRAAH
ncbi:MAG: hypothetical protein C4523_01455 [Myxococcales bacterium]|nr:MAG: hypothetical protein C4523_01455 [Myxococcales bacterium]